jgi:hypothetical protein
MEDQEPKIIAINEYALVYYPSKGNTRQIAVVQDGECGLPEEIASVIIDVSPGKGISAHIVDPHKQQSSDETRLFTTTGLECFPSDTDNRVDSVLVVKSIDVGDLSFRDMELAIISLERRHAICIITSKAPIRAVAAIIVSARFGGIDVYCLIDPEGRTLDHMKKIFSVDTSMRI